MFYGKATSTGYTNFQIGFYPRVIVYNFVWDDNHDPSSTIAFGLRYNSKLNTEMYLWSAAGSGISYYGRIKFYESSVAIKNDISGIPVYFVIFG